MAGGLLTVSRTTFARAAFLPQMQTIYCNWWDAEEPRKWRVTSGPSTALRVNEWREKEPGSRPGRDKFRPATTKERGKNSREGSKTKSRAKRKSKSAP